MNVMQYKKFIQKLLLKSGAILLKGFKKDFIKSGEKEGNNNIVTEYDLMSEDFIVNEIRNEYTSHSIISEERDDLIQNSEYSWIIDPLDGTVNFANKIPIFSISIALQKNEEIIAGGIYNPMLDELFYAEKNQSAFLNSKRITVSKKRDFNKSLLVTGFSYDITDNPELQLQAFNSIVSKGIPIRRLGSAALDLAYVAAGRFDGFWEANLKSWDVAAGILIVREAKGMVTDYQNNISSVNDKSIVATNNIIHKNIIEIVNL